MADEIPFRPLSSRLTGQPADTVLHDGVPAWLSHPLRDWLTQALNEDEDLARRVVMRLRWARTNPYGSYVHQLIQCSADQLLTVADAVLQLDTVLWQHVEFLKHRPDIRDTDLVKRLNALLADGGSRYIVDSDRRRLTVCIDPTVTTAANVAAGHPTAGDHLRTAWAAVYGLQPDPDKAYDEAVLAVEAVGCPLVCPANTVPTLGTMIRDLNNQSAKWALAIGDKIGQPAGPERLIEMLRLLWEGQSRHAGAANARRQTQAEAEAAVHLAATLVQWLSSGVLYRR